MTATERHELKELVETMTKLSVEFATDTEVMLKKIVEEADNIWTGNSPEELMQASAMIGACARSILRQLDVNAFINLDEYLDEIKRKNKLQ